MSAVPMDPPDPPDPDTVTSDHVAAPGSHEQTVKTNHDIAGKRGSRRPIVAKTAAALACSSALLAASYHVGAASIRLPSPDDPREARALALLAKEIAALPKYWACPLPAAPTSTGNAEPTEGTDVTPMVTQESGSAGAASLPPAPTPVAGQAGRPGSDGPGRLAPQLKSTEVQLLPSKSPPIGATSAKQSADAADASDDPPPPAGQHDPAAPGTGGSPAPPEPTQTPPGPDLAPVYSPSR